MSKETIKSNFIVAIVGRPNVGKSTLFNKIVGKNRAILSDIPGTTRDILYENVTWNGLEFTLADTAGIELDTKSELEKDIFLQVQVALQGADLIIFMTDVRVGQQTEDLKAAELIRKLNKPVVLAANKAESKKYDDAIYDFYKLGLGEPVLTSAISGKGVGDILDLITKKLKSLTPLLPEEGLGEEGVRAMHSPPILPSERGGTIRVAIIGRPNTGKSTLLNKLANKKMSLVSNQPGTTRDTVRTVIPTPEFQIELTDTAGLRRRGKVEQGIEKFSSLLVIRAVKEADIVLLVMDASDGILAQDLHVAQIIEEEKKGAILITNKWDMVEKDHRVTADYDKYLEHKFAFMTWPPHLYISALTGQRTDKIIDEILNVWASLNTKIPSKSLNNLIGDAYASNPPKGRRKSPKIYFASQVGVNPPVIKLKVNYPEELHFSYLRYLEKQLRAKYPMVGAPIKWAIIQSSSSDVVK
ncbi:MAG: ribosome biogenesis GTPase Der [Patescibacteria group bacterium]